MRRLVDERADGRFAPATQHAHADGSPQRREVSADLGDRGGHLGRPDSEAGTNFSFQAFAPRMRGDIQISRAFEPAKFERAQFIKMGHSLVKLAEIRADARGGHAVDHAGLDAVFRACLDDDTQFALVATFGEGDGLAVAGDFVGSRVGEDDDAAIQNSGRHDSVRRFASDGGDRLLAINITEEDAQPPSFGKRVDLGERIEELSRSWVRCVPVAKVLRLDPQRRDFGFKGPLGV